MTQSTYSWSDLDLAVEKAFAVWVGRHEQQWGARVWEVIVRRGLSSYSNELERHLVIVRFVALAAIYADFCELAWDEQAWDEYATWTEDLELDQFHLGQLIGQDANWNDPISDESLQDSALRFLADRARRQVYERMIECFGDVSGLYDSLLRTTDPDPVEYQDAEGNEYIEINTPYDEQRVYEWLQNGCPPIFHPQPDLD